MRRGRSWNIRTHTLLISLGPALLLTALLTGFFTYSRLQDLREERINTGQLIANQLATATEYGVLTGNPQVLKTLLQATLETPQVRFLEVRDPHENILVYVEQKKTAVQEGSQIELFNASIQMQSAPSPGLNSAPGYLGRVVVGISNDAFNSQQQLILLKASALALGALLLTFLLARRLARRLVQPISNMAEAVKAIQAGNFQATVPERGNAELIELAQHINNLASGLQQAQIEQQQAINQLIKTREEAEQASKAKSDFLAMMSHELRTPMNGVLGMLQLLETTELSHEQSEYAELAVESTEHLLKVINDILDFSRIERGALELECIPFLPAELLRNSVQVFQHSAQQRGLQLDLQLAEGLQGIQAFGDPTRIRQILVNLIGNALKFTEQGSICIDVAWRQRDEDSLWLTCAVQDTGIGIASAQLDAMFDAFRQADSSISRRYGGTGLGLPIARTLAECMGGRLTARSQEGQGSTFTLEIPLFFCQHGQCAGRSMPAASAPPTQLNVLLVEDNAVNRSVIEAMLRSLGHRVICVSDGAAGHRTLLSA